MAATLKQAGKRAINYPEDPAPAISVNEWAHNHSFSPLRAVTAYITRLFPFFTWITRYNPTWAYGDLIAGLTVGIVLVPQSMSYAQIATLEPQYGLYSSFVGVFVYCFFATSKDVSIGPVAVMSLLTSQIIAAVQASNPGQWEGPQIATTVSFVCGFIVLGIGLLRLGWIVEFISAPAVSGFMSGSAINIVAGQVPGLMGISGFNTRGATYLVIIDTLKGLPRTTLDAAFGLVGLFALYAIRITLTYLTKRYPRRARTFFFISVLRNAFVIIILTIAAWLYTRHRFDPKKKTYPIKILETVPAGFQHVGAFSPDPALVRALGPQIPVATIILFLEHIAIAKSFGRINNYKIDPNQELVAIGVTNAVGTVFNAYPATGSFSRSALKSKSGVRTPAAGWLTGLVVIVALYGLTPAFYWIPSAGLSAIIIHAVADLVASPAQVYAFWRVSPLEWLIWVAAVLVTVFTTIEIGLYTSVIASFVLLLVRVAFPRGHFLGRVTLRSARSPPTADAKGSPKTEGEEGGERSVYVPLDLSTRSPAPGVLNPQLSIAPPPDGVIIYRLEESVVYPNAHRLNRVLVDHVKTHTRRGMDMAAVSLGDRAWNDPGPRRGAKVDPDAAGGEGKPRLRAIVLDFVTVSHIDTTGVQNLVDARSEIERWADRPVEFHFAHILSPWIRRALIAGGFGGGSGAHRNSTHELASVVPYRGGRTEVGRASGYGIGGDADGISDGASMSERKSRGADPETPTFPTAARVRSSNSGSGSSREEEQAQTGKNGEFEPVVPSETPHFHFDLSAAVAAAERAYGGVSGSA